MLTRSDIEVEVRVIPRVENRYLFLDWDSEAGSGESRQQLDGAEDAVLHTWLLRDQLPANYTFEAKVLDARGKVVATDRAEIHRPDSGDGK